MRDTDLSSLAGGTYAPCWIGRPRSIQDDRLSSVPLPLFWDARRCDQRRSNSLWSFRVLPRAHDSYFGRGNNGTARKGRLAFSHYGRSTLLDLRMSFPLGFRKRRRSRPLDLGS